MSGLRAGSPSKEAVGRWPSPPLGVSVLEPVAAKLRRATGRAVLVHAPAGYGKTSQVAAGLTDDPRPVAWMVIGGANRDPVVLIEQIATALHAAAGIEVGRPGTAPPAAPTTEWLHQALQQPCLPFVMVLDDVHELEGEPASALLDMLVQDVPEGCTLVLVGRAEPPMHLPRWRCGGALVDITAPDLQVGEREATQMLSTLGLTVAADDVRRLVEETEGWPTGIRFAAVALQDADPPGQRDSLEDERAIARYLCDEWLGALSPEDRDLLLRCSSFTPLSGSLCDWVLDRSDSGERLERLSGGGAMVVPLDDRGTYRMHGLLRRVLAHELERSDRRGHQASARRASEWFEATGQIDEAIRHAVIAGDGDRAERLVLEHAPAFHTQGLYATVDRWVQTLGRAHIVESPALCLVAALTALGLGDSEAAEAWVRYGTRTLDTGREHAPEIGLRLATLRSLFAIGPIGPALDDAVLAHEGLPHGLWHAGAAEALGLAAFAVGDLARARDAFTEAVTEARLVGAVTVEAICRAHLAVIELAEGDPIRARLDVRATRSLVRDHHLEQMPTTVLVTAVSAWVEAMDGNAPLARAEAALTRLNLARIRSVGATMNVQARLALAHAALSCGDWDDVRRLLDETEGFLRAQPDAVQPRAQIEKIEARLAASARTAVGLSSLSNAELRVLHLLPTNLSLAEIGQRLFISRNTAKTHAAAVYRKLNVSSRSAAVDAARAAGLLPAEAADGSTS